MYEELTLNTDVGAFYYLIPGYLTGTRIPVHRSNLLTRSLINCHND